MQDHRQLRVWTKAHARILNVRRATHRFPRIGYASLKSQMTRAAESIAFNIVEGCGSSSQKELARFLDISIKSASELDYQLVLAGDYGVLADGEWKTLSEATIDVLRMLCGLRRKVLEAARESRSITDRLATQ
jgi:four helix bundle protein